MELSVTNRALSAMRDVLTRTDFSGHQALRLTPDDNRKLEFILDTPGENDVLYRCDDVIVMILDRKLSRDLRRHVLDLKKTSEGVVWTLRDSEGRPDSSS